MPSSSATNAQRVINEKVVKVNQTGSPMFEVMQEISGLSTDVKPTDVATGSVFFEVDTDKIYMYDAENTTWYEVGAEAESEE